MDGYLCNVQNNVEIEESLFRLVSSYEDKVESGLIGYTIVKNIFSNEIFQKTYINFISNFLKKNIMKQVLILGVKEFPYGVSSRFEKFGGGGIAKVVIDLILEIEKYDIEFHLIVRKMPRQKHFEKIGNLNIYRVKWINNKHLRLPSFNFFSFLKAFSIIRRVDIIHAHDKPAMFFGIILSKLFNKPYLANPHGGPLTYRSAFNRVITYFYKMLEKFTLKYSGNLIFLSEAERKQLFDEYKLFQNNFIIPTGISPIKLIREKSEKFIVLYIGRIVPRKGLRKFIESFTFLPSDIQNKCIYFIVGDGFALKELKRLVSELNLESQIILPGFTTSIETYLKKADLFILPSEGGEGLPVSVLEAMSVGIPCIISNFKAPFHSKSYYHIENNQPETIANVILDLYRNKEKYENYSFNSMNEFKNFSVEDAAHRYLELYHKF